MCEVIVPSEGLLYFREWEECGHLQEGVLRCHCEDVEKEAFEKDRVKFLQEPAIMGEFSHPNVVKLHGYEVVTIGEPVC